MYLPMTSSTSSSFHSISLSPHSFPANSAPKKSRADKIYCTFHNKDASFGHHHSYDGKLVDENMIVLRMRIREAIRTSEETRGDDVAPPDWMEWERKYYAENYDSDICEAVGLLQTKLMDTRPSLSLAMLGLISLSVPISMAVVLLHLVDVAKEVMDVGFHIY